MLWKSVIVIVLSTLLYVKAFEVKLENDGPIVIGGTIHFKATVSNGNHPINTQLKYKWTDNAIPQHSRESEKTVNPIDSWNVTYTAGVYPAGAYIVQVVIYKCMLVIPYCYEDGSARIQFDITETLNGELILQQKNQTIKNNFVSTKDEVVQMVKLKKTDVDLISKATKVWIYWFVDCIYYEITDNLEFVLNYTSPYENHIVEVLIMADFTPPTTTTLPPTSTTSKTTTVSPSTTVTTTKKPTTPKILSTESTVTSKKIKRHVTDPNLITQPPSNLKTWKNGVLVPYNVSFPYICNSSDVLVRGKQIYGYFYKKFQAKDPLSKVNITGNNWLQPGEMLSLKVQCNGSKPYEYCAQYKRKEYNVTGNETCNQYISLDECNFPITRYFNSPKTTVVIIIKNDVNKEVTPVTVNIYEVKKQSQLSVIVVPVASSLVAVVLIVFGVAYYFQNRIRFIIEVADFNFGEQYSDMEYKTFRERLRDSISNAFTRAPTPSSSEVPVWPPGRKYGSMT